MANTEPTGNGAIECAETDYPHQQDVDIEANGQVNEDWTAEASVPVGRFTLFTSTTPAQLGKVYSLVAGKLDKQVAGHMIEGHYEVKTFSNKEGLAQLLSEVGTNQALCHSLPRIGALAGLVSTKLLAPQIGCLARTKEDFVFKLSPGVMTLDYDPEQFDQVLTAQDLWSNLLAIAPAVEDAGAVNWCSGSSYIYGPAGEYQGLKGQRTYLLVQDICDIPRAGQNLADRCWLAGKGRIKISKSGRMLFRTLWDESMHEAARLDFIGGAICKPPLRQQRGEPVTMGGSNWLDTRVAFPDLDESEKASVQRLKNDARSAAQPAAAVARGQWLENRVAKESDRLHFEEKVPLEEARILARRMNEAALDGMLYGDYLIPLPNGAYVAVAEVLNQPQKWNKVKTLDPIEPEHRNYEPCGILYLDGAKQCLFSFAHGGTTYALARQPRRIECRPGDQSTVADELAKALCSSRDIYWSGGSLTDLVQAGPDGFDTLDKPKVQYLLGHRAVLIKTVRGVATPMNIPADLAGLTMAALGRGPEQAPPTLTAVTRLPYATVNQRLVTQPGFDSETGIYNTMPCVATEVPDIVSLQDVIDALACIWKPWSEYRFANDSSRGAMLAAIFTAVLRPSLSIAPGVFFDAPTQNSGKTKAALALGSLMTGEDVGVYSFVPGASQEAEYAKSILALLRGPRRVWIIDNVTGQFDSAVLAALITSSRVQGRILGSTKDADFSGRVMMVATGNNAQLGPDLSRRYLTPRIDTGVERPGDLPHTFEPAIVAKQTRMKIATAVLTILKAYWQDIPVVPSGGSDYAEWTALVRAPVLWLQRSGLTKDTCIGLIDDPVKTFGSPVISAETLGFSQLLQGALYTYGKSAFFAKQVVDLVCGSVWSEGRDLMRDGLENIAPGRDVTPRSLGAVLRNRVDRVVCGLQLCHAGDDPQRGALWKVRELNS